MAVRECDARSGFQVALKGHGSTLIGKLDDDVK
jgi:hypothetical protein